ncbi:hypothetical protein NVB75_17740 [Pseudomonas sp. CBS]|uniref:hypothetical protein n=1 Tax=Pseudomonas TaxID=286 RepID=UPI0021AC2F82|nr:MULTISPECIES: hypothetical protein [unclassified Pseudomonas]WEL62057.1 hypothetical protein P0D93_16775 [Pseudomonas sp. CBSPGW29]WEL71244.1 hypothetical protein P0D94_02725 [Pseudomonas sp. CBSPCGW29]WEL78159.1 hypothetical protein P0D92_08710 [Pseudomonas sp. CBSPAW29]WEL83199.1 hypothetical protein P0D95_03695 [Pseudomonas sp. CBSPCAW29]WEL86073.1 hypothetical protein P0D90_19370 [Pseudomonas sp. CBSPCBW29]
MAAYIDSAQGGAAQITVSGRGTPGYRVYLNQAGTGATLGSGVVGSNGIYSFTTQEAIVQNLRGQTINVQVRETVDNVNYSDWSLTRSVTIS